MAIYKFLSFFYDLIDVLYFNRAEFSPRAALLKFIPDTPVRVLDVCAGTGSNSLVIAKHKVGAKITVLDRSSEMLKIADRKIKEAKVNNIEIKIADACDTGFCSNSFDIVLFSLVLHEIDEDLRHAMLTEAKRILRNDGRTIVIEWEQPTKLFQRLMFWLIKLIEPKGFLRTDLSDYFLSFGYTVHEKLSCDYTQVIMLSKQ